MVETLPASLKRSFLPRHIREMLLSSCKRNDMVAKWQERSLYVQNKMPFRPHCRNVPPCCRINAIWATWEEQPSAVTRGILFWPRGTNVLLILRKESYFKHVEQIFDAGSKTHITFCTEEIYAPDIAVT